MDEKVYVSKEGLEEIKERLLFLKSVRRKEVADKIAEARSYGDLSENSEYDIAREEQATVEAEIFDLENKVKHAVIIDPKKINTSKVSVGCTVQVLNMKMNREFSYKIVGDAESEPAKGIISNISPVGAGLMGKKVGEVAVVRTPAGMLNFKVLAIKA